MSSRSEKRRRITFTLAACALTMSIRACRFPASISSWLKSLPVGCGSPQAAQQPASRHWAGELRGCSSRNFPREEASGGLSLFGTPRVMRPLRVSSQGCPMKPLDVIFSPKSAKVEG
jgi:hypothetical protein